MRGDYYSPKGKYLWDPWLIKEKDTYHVFYLQAPRKGRYSKRHDNHVTIGHAISKDLINWKELPTALKPGRKGEWDDFTLWTGTIIKKSGIYYMFYTGRNHNTKHIQKIGLATSRDLKKWKKHPANPLVEADKKWYETDNRKNSFGKAGAWRDPSITWCSETKKYYMTLSARSSDKKKEYDGCIGLAESKNLLDWEVQPPLIYPKKYDEMENSQIIQHKGRYYLFFSIPYTKSFTKEFAKKHGRPVGLHCYSSESIKGPYRPVNKNGVVLPNGKNIYALQVINQKGDVFSALGWLRNKGDKHIAKLAYPIELKIEGNTVKKL